MQESQNGWGWQGLLEIASSNPSAEEGPPRIGCPCPCSNSFWISPGREILQHLWAACASFDQLHSKKVSSCVSKRILYLFVVVLLRGFYFFVFYFDMLFVLIWFVFVLIWFFCWWGFLLPLCPLLLFYLNERNLTFLAY